MWVSILIQHTHWKTHTYWFNKHTHWKTFSWNFPNCNGVSVQWIYPGLISDSKIRRKSLIWLAGLRKNMKSCHIKDSLNRVLVRKIIQFSEAEEAANTDGSKKLSCWKIYWVCWSTLNNDWPYLTHAFPDL